MTTILITGAAGLVGGMLRSRLARQGRTLRLVDVRPITPVGPAEACFVLDICGVDALAEVCDGVNAVVHLAGIATEGTWEDIARVNIDGTRAALEAARRAAVTRVALASSNHAVGFHTRPADGSDLPAGCPHRPDTYYGVSKATMEALGSLYADRYGMDVAALRIGSCFPEPSDVRGLGTWLSPDDCGRLVEAVLGAPAGFGYRQVWGVSANTRRWWSLAEGRALGYEPHDDAEQFAAGIPADLPGPDYANDPVLSRVGGAFCDFPLGEPG
ncbi:NAD(P)-dependent oxidoreductase [Pilimelia columellifera]|uniref:NAD(P)-dependent oxidoreductase n=1 Tax=Pilimelia columellifera subsp. columellifera TaxID=706583 RepID=A0ABP6AZG3_9ACTN